METGYDMQLFILSLIGTICLLVMFFSLVIDYQSKIRKAALLIIELSSAVLLLSDIGTYIFKGDVSALGYTMVRICNFLGFILLYGELLGLNIYVHSYVPRKNPSQNNKTKLFSLLFLIGILLVVISQFTGIYYSFDSTNHYVRGPLFGFAFVIPLILVAMVLEFVYKNRNTFPKLILDSIVLYIVLPFICMVIQVFSKGLSLFNISIGLASIIVFVFSLVELNGYLTELACTEKLTGLPNAHGLMMYMGQKIARREITDYDAVYFDIVRMGLINRKYGNQVGDYVVKQYASIINSTLLPDEILGRLGGNYFIALIRKENIRKFIDLLQGVEISIETSAGKEEISVSSVAGIYEVDDNNLEPAHIMTYVSMAVNIAKNVMKKPYVFLTRDLLNEMSEQRQLQSMIPSYMENGEFVPYYQPKVDISTNRLCGAEALARWNRQGDIIPPPVFIPLMEQNEFICKFDFYMLEQICRDIKNWIDSGIDIPVISMNFSRKNLGNKNLAKEIFEVVKKYDISPSKIQIEITETIDEYTLERLENVVKELQEYGFTVAIDDFGIGSSSIKLIKEVSFDVLKVDKSFIDSVSEKDCNILRHIIGMAHEVGAKIITEGVEREDQIQVLKKLGCREVQGFFYDKPLEKGRFEERLKNPVY